MKEKQIDAALTEKILNNYNSGVYDDVKPLRVSSIPDIDGETILDLTKQEFSASFDRSVVEESLANINAPADLVELGEPHNNTLTFSWESLHRIGTRLYPFFSYGILNGGSATSYVDKKKNRSYSPVLFDMLFDIFESIEPMCEGNPKGITPGYINPDHTPGVDYLILKLRSLVLEARRYQHMFPDAEKEVPLFPLFQMTSPFTHEKVEKAFAFYQENPFLQDLIEETGIDATKPLTGIQPLLAAFSHSSEGDVKFIFTEAHGKKDEVLAIPGGHGQNFSALKECYQELYEKGKRFVSLGNVDNNGYTVNPVALALLALSGRQAGFEFSHKTQVDVKGGVLIYDQNNHLNCGDLGAAVSKEEIEKAESEGRPILFNCATAIFNLEYLVENIDYISEHLPMRFSDQEKDAGKYSQAEQITWEVIGLLDTMYIFAVNKYERFLAAKTLIENIISSGIALDNPEYPEELKEISRKLSSGLYNKLAGEYGLELTHGRWAKR